MTQEEKELLLKDLCARLPYHTLMNGKLSNNIGRDNIDFVLEPMLLASAIACGCKPYLRPMDSMTEGEKEDYNSKFEGRDFSWEIYYGSTDWLNAHHFDYRGLIPKGLALEAPEDMYK